MSWLNIFTNNSNQGSAYLPDLYPMPVLSGPFVKTDVVETFRKILVDTLERTQGIAEELEPLFWDNCLRSEAGNGLVTLVAEAMHDKADLFLVFDKATKVLRRAKGEEADKIRLAVESGQKSDIGIFVTFKNFQKIDMVKLYSGLEYCVVDALNKSTNVAKSVQYKISDLRGSVSLIDATKAKAQALEMATALSNGKDIYLDAKDELAMLKPDLESAKAAMEFFESKRCFYLGLPVSYISGHQVEGGLSDTGQGDAKAVDRGLKAYYFSIVKPIVEALFGSKTTFKSQDLSNVKDGLEALKTFELMTSDKLSLEDQKNILSKLFDL